MKTIRIDQHRVSSRALNTAVEALRRGGVVVFPTDTAYGLAAVPTDPRAVKKIYAIKGREIGKALPLIAASFSTANSLVFLLGKAKKLANKYWPGPLTIVAPLRRKKGKWHKLTGLDRTVAVRVPRSLWARRLARSAGGIVTATSANLSGKPTPYAAAAVRRALAGRRHVPDVILDAGRLPRRPVSTIVEVVRGKIQVLRQGAVKIRN